MPEDRQRRPSPVERVLRQEACYGCCKCGHPIFQYHHIVPYTEQDPHYRPQDMMVLCPNCHDEATQGVLKEPEQRRLKADPYNRRQGYVSGQLAVEHREARIHVGDSVAVVAQGSLLEIDGHSLLGLTIGADGDLRISVDLYDRDDALLARIVENQWETGDPLPWDLDFGYRHLVVREANRKVSLDLDLRDDHPQIKGRLWRKGRYFKLGADGITWAGGGGIRDLTLDGFAVRFNTRTDTFDLGAPRATEPLVEVTPGRNDLCWCGSQKKFKRCHGR